MNIIATLALTSLLVCQATALFAQDLNLAERRALATYQSSTFPAQLAAVHKAAGMDVPVDVKWEAIAIRGEADNYNKDYFWTAIYFVPLVEALKSITADEMGRTALKAKLKRIVITFDDATANLGDYASGLKFADGELTVNFQPNVNADDVKQRASALTKLLENNL